MTRAATGTPADIAIVGMAGLYPGADDIDLFWENILDRRYAVTEAPEGWLGDGDIYDPDTTELTRIYTNKGGFLGDLSRFDPKMFGTMPLSVEGGQPDQFLALKCAHDALSDAGYAPGRTDHSRTGVILGHSIHMHRANANGAQQVWFHAEMRAVLRTLYPDLPDERLREAVAMMTGQMPKLTSEAVPGLVPNVLTGRIANRFDLMGPNYIIDAACSSSIIAVDLAMTELREGRADMMLAGGVNTTTSPLVYSVFCSVGALSRSGEIRPFDSGANGTVLGEGVGVIALKRLDDALAADDRIYAVIKGVGQSSDGKSSGLMAPRLEGEVLAIRRAYEVSGLDPASVGLIEAHGTGIPLGDRTEVSALRKVFGERGGAIPRVPIGSVKSMIGHCIPAAGSAAIIKNALALTHKVIPPTLCHDVHGGIGLEETPFYVATETRPWVNSAPTPRRSAINAFGFGGINAHMILEEAPGGRSVDATACFLRPAAATGHTEQVFVYAGRDRAALLAALATAAGASETASAEEFDAAAAASWDALPGDAVQRLAVVAASPADLAKKLGQAADKLADAGTTSLQTRNGLYFHAAPMDGKVAFLFPGEMAQYPGLIEDAALAFPPVRAWFDDIAALTETRRGIRLQDVAFPAPTLVDGTGRKLLDRLMHQVDYGSEMVFAADQAIFGLLTGLGIRPDAMLGHSTGENAAIVASGCTDMDRAGICRMIADMNTAFTEVNDSGVVPSGVLLNVAALPRADLLRMLDDAPGVHFTLDNCPNQAIVFGPPDRIEALQDKAVAEGAVCTRLPISWGYHTDYVAPMAERFTALFADVKVRKTDVTLYSCATAAPFPRGKTAILKTAAAQYTSRVRFSEAVERLYADGCRIFVECGPNATLTAFVRDILGDRPYLAEAADNRRRGTVSQLRHLVARLFSAGRPVARPDLLSPQDTADATRRRAARAAHRKAPKLPSELPFLSFGDEDAARLREILGTSAVTPALAPSAAAAPAGAGVAQPRAAAPPGAGATMQGHQALMTDFIHRTETVVTGAIGAPALHTGTTAPPPAPPRQPIGFLDLAPAFETPFAVRAYLMRGAPDPAGLTRHLSAAEAIEAQALLGKGPDGRAWREWSLSRLAVKRAARELLAARAVDLDDSDLEIAKTGAGAPILRTRDGAGPLPAVSIAHVRGIGLGAAGDPGWRLGIDYELPGRIRVPAEFLASVLGADEHDLLGRADDRDTAGAVWSLKEAAAKAVGQGIQGRPQAFRITRYDPTTGRAEVVHGQARIDTVTRRIGDGVCSLAYMSAA